ncbi:MAG: glycoside hydrolase family 16 protein [Saprospiraceae bacterium]|nr:glycoside hydrolase family 16 protein [Lewinella sp.]
MRLIFALTIICVLTACQKSLRPGNSSHTDRQLLWSDEFETDGLPDPEKWSYDVGGHGWGNNELEYYTKDRLENARIEDGKLIIEARKETFENRDYTSARLVTKNKGDWQYGRVEVKAKLPRGRGTWPAIWMLPTQNTYGGWPKSGEIDIMEHVGFDPGNVHGTVHTEAYNHTKGTQKGGQLMLSDAMDAFHVYAIEWSAEKIDFFIDDELYFTFLNEGGDYKSWPFSQPFHLILNIAVGGNWGGQQGVDESIWPQRMEVEYVRIYDKE